MRLRLFFLQLIHQLTQGITNRTGFVYRAVLSLMASGTAVDMLTVENEMRRLDNGLYIQLNGLSFLSDMLLDVRSDAHIRIHADGSPCCTCTDCS